MRRPVRLSLGTLLVLTALLPAWPAAARALDIGLGEGGAYTGRIWGRAVRIGKGVRVEAYR